MRIGFLIAMSAAVASGLVMALQGLYAPAAGFSLLGFGIFVVGLWL